MSSFIEISSDDLNVINQSLDSSPKDNILNESSELEFPSFGEYGVPNPATLFVSKKTGIRPDTEIVDLISPSKPLSPLDSSLSIPTSTQHDCVFLEINSSPPLDQDGYEGSQNHSFANWDDMISEIPSLNDISPQAINWGDMINEVPNSGDLYSSDSNSNEVANKILSLNDISAQAIDLDYMINEIPSLNDLSPHITNWDENANEISNLAELSPQAINWDNVINETPNFEDAFSQDDMFDKIVSDSSSLFDLSSQAINCNSIVNPVPKLNSLSQKSTQSKETIARLNKARPVAEDACKQLFIKHSKDWVEENSDIGLTIINSIKSLDIDLIPCNESKIPWCLEFFMIQNFEINKNDGIFYPVAEDQYKIATTNKILLKWDTEEIIEDLENFNWSPSKMSMTTSYNCRHEKFVYTLYPKSITVFITNYDQVINTLQKQSKKTFEQQMAVLSQIPSNDSSSLYFNNRQHYDKNGNSEKIQHLEQFLNYVQIKYSMNLVFMDNAADIVSYTKLFSSTVATIPFRTESNHQGQKLNMEQLQSKKIPSMSDLSSSQNYFYKQLQQIPGVAPLIAKTIVTTYPSPRHLIKAYQAAFTDAEKLCLISNLSVSGDSLSQTSRVRTVGNSVAQKLLKIFYCSNGNDTIL